MHPVNLWFGVHIAFDLSVCLSVCHTKRLFRELLLHFLSDQLQTSHVVPSSPAVVCDINFISIGPRVMELLPFEDFKSGSKWLFRDLRVLLHILSDQLQTSHVSPSPAVVRDTNFISVRPRVMELLPFEDFKSSSKRQFDDLLLHFLTDPLQTSHVGLPSQAVVLDTNFILIWPRVMEVLPSEVQDFGSPGVHCCFTNRALVFHNFQQIRGNNSKS